MSSVPDPKTSELWQRLTHGMRLNSEQQSRTELAYYVYLQFCICQILLKAHDRWVRFILLICSRAPTFTG